MNEILTLQQISDIDTFTLEQKIQQLEQHPLAAYYDQLITFAKLELNERIKVQEFGRMLLNDEIPIFPDIPIKTSNVVNKKNPSKSQRRIQFVECLKRSLITDQKQLKIGPPVISNYRYVPRQPMKTSRQKKKSVVDEKKRNNNQKIESKRKSLVPKPSIPLPSIKKINQPLQNKVKLLQEQEKNKKSSQLTVSTNKSSKSAPNKAIKQEQKKESVAVMKIKYIQNDVYDGQKLILDKPQKLSDLKLDDTQAQVSMCSEQQQKINKEQIEKELQVNENKVVELIIKQQMVNIQDLDMSKDKKQEKLKQEQQIIKEDIIEQNNQTNKSELNITQKDISHQIKQKSSNRNSFQEVYQKSSIQPTRNQHTINNISMMNQQKESKKSKLSSVPEGQTKIKSLSHFVKSTKLLSVYQKNVDETDELAIIMPKPNLKEQNSQNRSEQKRISNMTKGRKLMITQINKEMRTESQSIRSMPVLIYNYHEIIPSFNRLFPHSNSLINDLRSIQKQLSDHIEKKINKVSLSDEYLRIRENQLLFKVVSETQKANTYKHVFDISLDSFIHRSQILMDRINKNIEAPVENQILLYRVVRQKQDVYDIINNSFHRTQNWFELPHGMDLKTSWNLLWTWSKPQIDIKELFYFQKVNHFFGNKQIARKDLLKKNIQRIKRLGPKAKSMFDIIPQTYYLPGQNMQFVRKFRQYSMKPGLNYWIMKPVGLSRGRGIELVTQIEDIVFNQPIVLQKYLQNPLLLGDYKFDMRIYVLVTSMNPLQAYVYKQGFARISTEKYSLDDENVKNKYIHLTNFSVQKQNLEQDEKPKQIFALNELQKQIGGCKITLKTLQNKLLKQGIKWEPIQSQIDSIVLKSLVSTMNVIESNPNCFELFGYDIIIDENLKCWLLEVNSSPSLQKDFTIDEIVKQQLVDDIIEIVDPIPYDRQRLLQVVTRRRKQMQGLKSHINTQNNSFHQLNSDLHYILNGRTLRKYGEVFSNKNFRRVAPGEVYQSIIKTVQSYKLTSITKQEQS